MDSDEGWNRWLILPLPIEKRKEIFLNSFSEKDKEANIIEGVNRLNIISDSRLSKAKLRFHKDNFFGDKYSKANLINNFKEENFENNFYSLDDNFNNNSDDLSTNNFVLQKLPYIY